MFCQETKALFFLFFPAHTAVVHPEVNMGGYYSPFLTMNLEINNMTMYVTNAPVIPETI